jgi:hypothetical protein
MPRKHKPKIGGYIYNQNLEIIRGNIVTISHLCDEITKQMEAIIDTGETAINLLEKKINFPFVQPVIHAVTLIMIQMSRFNNRLTKIRNNIGQIVIAAEENDRIVRDQLADLEPDIELSGLQEKLDKLLDLLENSKWQK